MTLKSGFFNSISSDRVYDATDMSSLFDGIINDGIFMSVGDAFMVTPSSEMTVSVGTGRAWFNHTWSNNPEAILLMLNAAEASFDRIDMIVLEINSSEEVRANTIKVIEGTPGSVPVPPDLISTELVHQYPLAKVYIFAGVTEILPENITYMVGGGSCPFVTGILQTINTDNLLAQWTSEFNAKMAYWVGQFDGDLAAWEAEFDAALLTWGGEFETWFNSIKDLLGTDPAGELAANLLAHKEAALPHQFTDGITNYKWGLSLVDGVLTFNYEEVV